VDLDDNVYVDYRMGYGPAILGYADARVDQAAREGMEVGGVFALSTEREFRVAERIAKMVPAAQLVRFSNSGTEAVMAALRLARAYTGKDDYVILEGSYHGLFDAAMWYTPMDKWGRVGEPEVYPYSEGVPLSTRNFAHFVQANDANQLEDVLRRHAGSIACLLIEPIMGNCLGIAADPLYIRAARELCDKHGVVLIIDEVKSGFRVARGGVQELYGVQADLCTFAKAIANGYPISVLAGREEIMRKIGRGVAHGGTYTAHPVSLAAADKTLQILDETDALERIEQYGTRLRGGMSAILKARGIAHSFVGHPSMSGLYFAHEPPRTYRDWKSSDYTFYDAAARVLHDERILCEPDSREPWFISAAHDDSCLRDTLAAFEVAIDTTLEGVGKSRKMPA
jgi:glutamate-1-semialdehyde 2,1-aminomutase